MFIQRDDFESYMVAYTSKELEETVKPLFKYGHGLLVLAGHTPCLKTGHLIEDDSCFIPIVGGLTEANINEKTTEIGGVKVRIHKTFVGEPKMCRVIYFVEPEVIVLKETKPELRAKEVVMKVLETTQKYWVFEELHRFVMFALFKDEETDENFPLEDFMKVAQEITEYLEANVTAR